MTKTRGTRPGGGAGPRPNPGTGDETPPTKPKTDVDARTQSIRDAVAKSTVPDDIADKVLALFRSVRSA